MNKLISLNVCVFFSLVGPSETKNSQFVYIWLKNATFQPEFDKTYFFDQHSLTSYNVMQNEIENLEFVQAVNFDITNLLKKNGTKCLVIFDNSCEEICNSKVIVYLATAGRHCDLITSYDKHNLVHRTKIGRDLQLQNALNVPFKFPVM